MNDLGRETLIQAGLAGHKQVKHMLHKPGEGGECALGVLHLAMHSTQEEALMCWVTGQWETGRLSQFGRPGCRDQLTTKFGLTFGEAERIVDLNDDERLDFIGIARKLEDREDGVPPDPS